MFPELFHHFGFVSRMSDIMMSQGLQQMLYGKRCYFLPVS